MIKPEEFNEGTPERKLAEFYEAWQGMNWDRMIKCLQKTSRAIVREECELVKHYFKFKPVDVEIVEGKYLNEMVFEARVKISYKIAREVTKTVETKVRVVKEKEAMLPDPDGEWGVNHLTAVVVI